MARQHDVVQKSGEVSVVKYQGHEAMADATVRRTGGAAGVQLSADKTDIKADGLDLFFVAVRVVDESGGVVPFADNAVSFNVKEPGEIGAAMIGDPGVFNEFASVERKACSGVALVIVRSSGIGTMTVRTVSDGLAGDEPVLPADR